ncbi:hypothetical protein E2C01_068108 [Portunus trituberculatus]|uniref:Uncharacterized protein n=1 Tax=Portunus trituberculatus TaxID=210409 RepID=A0A5B7HLK4_PORTR|nr:hypothetical protein [Portunus trituberculatus]
MYTATSGPSHPPVHSTKAEHLLNMKVNHTQDETTSRAWLAGTDAYIQKRLALSPQQYFNATETTS